MNLYQNSRFRVGDTGVVDKNVKEVIGIMAEKGVSHDEALAILKQRRAGIVNAEEDATGGDPLEAGKAIVTPESEDVAIREQVEKESTAAAAGGQQALPQVPEPAGGQRNMRLLELIGNLGSQFSQNRAIGKADKKTAQRQAYANLINTLRGSPTASVSPATPKEGILGTLARGVEGTGKALRESREAEAAGKADRFGHEVEVAKLRPAERDPGDSEFTMNNKLYRRLPDGSIKMVLDASDPKAPTLATADDGTVYEYDFDAKDDRGSQGAWVKLFDPKSETKDLSSLKGLFEERGRQYLTMEAFLAAHPEISDIVNGEGQDAASRGELRGSFIKGNREQKEEYEKALEARIGSAAERLTLAEAEATNEQLNDILALFASADITGMKFNVMNLFGIGFDPRENPLTQGFLRIYAENSTQLADTLAGFTVNIARIINGGRPSDKDARAAERLLPMQGEVITPVYDKEGALVGYEGLAARKIMFLQKLFSRRINSIKRIIDAGGDPSNPYKIGPNSVPPDSYLLEVEDFLSEASASNSVELKMDANLQNKEVGAVGGGATYLDDSDLTKEDN